MQPINYSIDVKDPFESALQGYQTGMGLRSVMDKQAEEQRVQQQQAQRQQMLAQLAANPYATAKDYGAAMTMMPDLSEQLTRAWTAISADQQQSELSFRGQIFSALVKNRPDLAQQMLRDRAAGKRNSGLEPSAKEDETMAELIGLTPDGARASVGAWLSAVPKGGDIIDSLIKVEKAPSEIRESEAKATTAEVNAKYAEPQALVNLEKDGWYIENVKSEIKYRDQQSRIAAMQASLAREGNELKRQELALKIQEAKQKLDSDIRTKVADVETARSTIDNLLNTVDRIKKNPALKDVVGSIEGGSMYPNAAAGLVNPFGSGADERSDVIALIESLGSQSSLAQLPAMRGTGSITDKEQEILRTSLQNLSRKQSEAQFMTNLGEVQRIMLKARKVVTTKYGVPESVPDTPAAAPAANDIDALVQKYAPGDQ